MKMKQLFQQDGDRLCAQSEFGFVNRKLWSFVFFRLSARRVDFVLVLAPTTRIHRPLFLRRSLSNMSNTTVTLIVGGIIALGGFIGYARVRPQQFSRFLHQTPQ
jgi:hypothetical protein